MNCSDVIAFRLMLPATAGSAGSAGGGGGGGGGGGDALVGSVCLGTFEPFGGDLGAVGDTDELGVMTGGALGAPGEGVTGGVIGSDP